MVFFAYLVAFLAVAAALASWTAGGYLYVRTSRALSHGAAPRHLAWRAIAWPFARGYLRGAAATDSAPLNKALVAFLACSTVAVSALSVATNLARVTR